MNAAALLIMPLAAVIGPSPAASANGDAVAAHADELMRCYNADVDVPENAGTFKGYLSGTHAK